MKSKLLLIVLLAALFLAACGGAASEREEQPAFGMAEAPMSSNPDAPVAQEFVKQDAAASGGDSNAVYEVGAAPDGSAIYAANHMIIKNADLRLLVEDTDVAIDRTTQVVGDLGGYIISSRAWYQAHYDGKSYKYATITMGMPVTQFEKALSRLRGISVQVLDENASGEDVSDQYVDLQSKLTNLEATRDRIKSFLDDAKSVDEALRINQELANIEAQIEQIKGQMNYLQDRSAFSTITVNFEPKLPELKPEPTPTPTPWNPGQTLEDAQKTVVRVYQGIVELLIWLFVVFVPIFAPPVLILWGLWKLFTRKPKKPVS